MHPPKFSAASPKIRDRLSVQYCFKTGLSFVNVNRIQTMRFHFGRMCITHIYSLPTGKC